MPGPLAGYRVVDLTAMIAGPFATMILADQGAEVIKVEPPGGEHVRAGGNRSGGLAATFLNNNRNKRSVVLDLKRPEGVEALKRLAATADVFVQNFRPGVVDRMGIGEAAIRAVAPNIVYVSMCGFGEEGPYAGKPVYDPLVQALSGLATVQAGSDEARPRLVRTIVPDKVTALTAAQAITAALLARERGGGGQHVRLSMLDAVTAFLWSSDMGGQTFVGREVDRQRAATFIDLIYETTDGHISVSAMTNRQWEALCRALGHAEWLEDPRFLTPALRDENADDRLELIQSALATGSSAAWLERLEAAGVPCAPVLKRKEVIRHPQLAANGTLVEYDHPVAGRLRQARPPARFERTPADVRHGAPVLGEATETLLAELGYDAAAIARLRAEGVAGA